MVNIYLAFLLHRVQPLYTRTSQESLITLYEVGGVHFYRCGNEGTGRSCDPPRGSRLLRFQLLQRTKGGVSQSPDSLALQTWLLVWALQWTSVPSRAGWLPVDTQEGVGKSKLVASGEEAMSFL